MKSLSAEAGVTLGAKAAAAGFESSAPNPIFTGFAAAGTGAGACASSNVRFAVKASSADAATAGLLEASTCGATRDTSLALAAVDSKSPRISRYQPLDMNPIAPARTEMAASINGLGPRLPASDA